MYKMYSLYYENQSSVLLIADQSPLRIKPNLVTDMKYWISIHTRTKIFRTLQTTLLIRMGNLWTVYHLCEHTNNNNFTCAFVNRR